MRIAAAGGLALERTDLSSLAPEQREAALQALVAWDARTPFDLADGPVVRGYLVTLSNVEHALIFSAHHIVCDGWSMNLILSELAESYNALRRGDTPQLPPAVPFAEYARRQTERDPAQVAAIEGYWLEQFAEPPAPLALPTDRPRPALKTYRGATRTAFVERDAYAQVKKAGARAGCTLFATLLGAFDLLVSRLADQPDVVVGVPAAGQGADGCASVVGHCVDFLPIRIARSQDATLASFLSEVKRRVLDAYEHHQYTLGTLVRKLALRRESGRVPIAEIQFNLELAASGCGAGGAQFDRTLESAVEPNPVKRSSTSISSSTSSSRTRAYGSIATTTATCSMRLRSNAGLPITAACWTRSCAIACTARSRRRLSPRCGARACDHGLNDTAADVHPHEQSVHGLIREAIAAHPERIALRCGDASLTYAELGARTNRLANYLHARGAHADERIAICVDRSIDMVVAMLATLAAGCSYVPLDPSHPPARLSRVMRNAGIAAVITDRSLEALELPNAAATIHLAREAGAIAASSADEPAAYVNKAQTDPAYVIYTSGSTGEPKGVAIARRLLVGEHASRDLDGKDPRTSNRRRASCGDDDLVRHRCSRVVPAVMRRRQPQRSR